MSHLKTPPHTHRAHRQRGAVAILLGLTLAVLIGFAGLAVDLGRFFVIKSELQNAMDACALAAASQLRPGQNNPNALDRAVAYGRVFTTGGVSENPLEGNIEAIRNRVNFQGQTVNVQPENITFATQLEGPYQSQGASDPNTAAFAQCNLPLADLPIFFFRVLNPLLSTQTVSARAVATLAPSASACAIPLAVCRQSMGTNFGITVGQWLMRPPGNPGSYGTGNFGWIDFTPPSGGASELADLLNGPGQCSVEVGNEVGQSGFVNSLDTAWNSRFGIYRGGQGNPQLATASPDLTGYGYTLSNWPAGAHAYEGASAGALNYRSATSSYQPYQFGTSGGYSASSATEHQVFGRFRRVVVAPVVDCGVWGNTGNTVSRPTIDGWACVLMLNPLLVSTDSPMVEFLGLSTDVGSPCATNGEPGTFGPLVPQLVQ